MSALEVVAVGPGATLQGAARSGVASLGVPAGGPLDPIAREAALAAVGGTDDDAVLELPLLGARFRAHGAATVSIDGAPPLALADGTTFSVGVVSRAVRCLAVRGGFDVPFVLGARGACLPGRFGGAHGRPLRRGDVLPIGMPPAFPAGARSCEPTWNHDEDLVCIPTATATRDSSHALALAALLAQRFTVDSRSDRVGVRLAGGAPTLRRLAEVLRTTNARSRPTLRGAIQLPPDGQPIVLGPDGPTFGGYPVLAVLEGPACAALARRRPGAFVRFRV